MNDIHPNRYEKDGNCMKTESGCSDSVVEENVKFLRDRSNVGQKKYGVTLDRDDLNPVEWVQHLREELADALNYVTVVQRKMEREVRQQAKLDILQKAQKNMRDPERQIVCDIIANGQLLPDPDGKRYGGLDKDVN